MIEKHTYPLVNLFMLFIYVSLSPSQHTHARPHRLHIRSSLRELPQGQADAPAERRRSGEQEGRQGEQTMNPPAVITTTIMTMMIMMNVVMLGMTLRCYLTMHYILSLH